jgi:predicted helicase
MAELLSSADNCNVYPLWIVENNTLHEDIRRPNFNLNFLKFVSIALNITQKESNGLPQGITSEDILYYIYAIFYSPEYRTRYAEFLKIDFPRLPLTSSLDLFRTLSELGAELVDLHLMESPKLDQHFTTYTGNAAPVVEKVSWANDTVWLDKKQSCGFIGVPETVWNFHIGGYQVCNKWLKDRKGRTLTAEDLTHYHRIVVALSETIRLMAEIDEVIEQYGGWPGAFSEKKD